MCMWAEGRDGGWGGLRFFVVLALPPQLTLSPSTPKPHKPPQTPQTLGSMLGLLTWLLGSARGAAQTALHIEGSGRQITLLVGTSRTSELEQSRATAPASEVWGFRV